MNIYIGNLDYKVSEADLEELFTSFGPVSSATLITDKFSGRSKGFGFVTMDDADAANKAISELNGTQVKDREIVVNEAKPRKNQY